LSIAAARSIDAARERLREYGIALELEPPDAAGPRPHAVMGIDAVVTLSRAEAKQRYAVVMREPMTVSALAHRAFPTSPDPLLIIGNRITRRSAAAFRDAGIQFVDALGNAFITFGSVFVEVLGRTEPLIKVAESRQHVRQRQQTNIFSSRRAQVILVLLTWPELSTATVREIANAAGVSAGQAHDALAQLEQAGFLVPVSRRLIRADELLDYWTAAYPTGLGRRLEIARYHGDPTRPISRPPAEQPIYLSSESAGDTGIARPATLTVYLDFLDPKLPIMNRWSSDPDRAPNIFVRRKFWVSPRPDEKTPSANERNAPWPLVYADLIAAGDARLSEVARAWRTRCTRSDEV